MAVEGRKSTEKTQSSRSLYTGLVDCKVIGVNPTLKEINDFGINLANEPTYVETEGDNARTRIDLWVQTSNPEKVISKMSLWMNHTLFVSGAGKPQWLNKYGRTAWFNDKSEAQEWFIADDVRQAYKGEEDIHKFLQAFLNTVYDTTNKLYDACIIDNPKAIIKGDVSELKSIFSSYKDNTVRLLFGVKDGQYQNIFNKYFEKPCTAPNYKNWQKNAIDAEFGAFKADFQNSWEFKPYTSVPEIPKADVDASAPKEEAF